MSQSDSCSVCTEPFTSTLRAKISCQQCHYNACKSCVTRYLLSQVVDAHCMNCRTGWNREFLDQHMTKAFRKGLWRDHRKKMIVIREKALLPNYQHYAAAKKRFDELKPILLKAEEEMRIHSRNRLTTESNMDKIKETMIRDPSRDEELIETLKSYTKEYTEHTIQYTLANIKTTRVQNDYHYNLRVYNNIEKKVEKRVFIMKCVKDGCRGFLSEAYKCELCSTYVCKDCMVIKKEKNDVEHVCKKEDVDTVSMIRKETRPCPKCGIRISKIDGCDQMWCTADSCGTAFSWMNGNVISGVIHNPHYYEWLRRVNNGEAPRNPGDVECGGIPHIQSILALNRSLELNKFYTKGEFMKILDFHRCLTDLEHVRIPHYNEARDENLLKDLHVDYLLGNITELKWTNSIYLKETNLEKKHMIGQVLTTFMNAGADLLRSVLHLLNRIQSKKNKDSFKLERKQLEPVDAIIHQIDTLKNYINESLEKIAETASTPVPQFDSKFNWLNSASNERIKAMREAEKQVSKVTTTT